MKKIPETVETEGGYTLRKMIAFAGIGMFKHPKTGEVIVVDFREEVGRAEA